MGKMHYEAMVWTFLDKYKISKCSAIQKTMGGVLLILKGSYSQVLIMPTINYIKLTYSYDTLIRSVCSRK